jgi:hypothetical protein
MSKAQTGAAMTRAKPASSRSSGKREQEQSIDRMIEDTFPASDATQLPGRAAGAPPKPQPSAQEPESAPPRTIGNQGVAPATRMLEETVRLGASGAVTLRFDAELRRLYLDFSEDGMALDAQALDRLIEALSTKRALLVE